MAETQSGLFLVYLGMAEPVWADLAIPEDLYFATETHVSFKTIYNSALSLQADMKTGWIPM